MNLLTDRISGEHLTRSDRSVGSGRLRGPPSDRATLPVPPRAKGRVHPGHDAVNLPVGVHPLGEPSRLLPERLLELRGDLQEVLADRPEQRLLDALGVMIARQQQHGPLAHRGKGELR
jgi:hypothetical protein